MLVYHGSDHIIETPGYRKGKRTNDYGYGFYMTENKELAKEWACGSQKDGIVNSYELATEELRILRLNAPPYNILNWLAILTKYRSYWQKGSISEEAKKYLQDHFFVDPEEYDIIIGYRADDSYFTFAQDFVSGAISLNTLSKAMRLGNLGEQIVLKSEESFKRIHFLGAESVLGNEYYEKKNLRDRAARRAYRKSKSNAGGINEIYMIDIMREGIENGDPRLQ